MPVVSALSELPIHLLRAFPVRWRMVRRCTLPAGVAGEPYYLSFVPGGGIFGERWDRFDENGVLFKGAYHPVSIAQYALHCYEAIARGQAGARDAFLAQVRYLRGAQQADGTLRYAFEHPAYGLQPGWISGLTQGEAFSVFFRAFVLTQDAEYRDRALSALKPFERSTADGGVTFMHENDVFFEEMPAQPTHILNGHLCAAFGVWEAMTHGLATPHLRDLHEASVETLLRWLPRYDARGWSYYQLAMRGEEPRRYVPITYHQLHVNQLHVYAAMTGREAFERTSRYWRDGLDRWDVRARVWRDSVRWVTQSVARRVRREQPGAWRSILEESAPARYRAEARFERSG